MKKSLGLGWHMYCTSAHASHQPFVGTMVILIKSKWQAKNKNMISKNDKLAISSLEVEETLRNTHQLRALSRSIKSTTRLAPRSLSSYIYMSIPRRCK